MIITRCQFESALTVPGLPVKPDIIPADHEGWLFQVVGDRLVITSPRGHLGDSASDAIREELAAIGNGWTPKEAVYVLTEPLSRVRLTLLDDGIPDVIEGPSKALRDLRAAKAAESVKVNEAIAAAALVEEQPRKKKPGPKPLNVPPGFRGNPTPPPSPPEEDAP